MSKRPSILPLVLLAVLSLSGCRSAPVQFDDPVPLDPIPWEGSPVSATRIDYPDVESLMTPEVSTDREPWTFENPADQTPWELSLEQVIEIALANGKVLRNLGGSVIQSAAGSQTVFEPALATTNPQSSVEAAMSAFDAQLSANLFWQKNDRPINQTFPGLFTPTFQQTFSSFTGELAKTAATGSRYSIRHHVNYDLNSNPTNRFPSSFNIDWEGEWRQPLLQGGGVEFNRIAGPNSTAGGANGVLIARLTEDTNIADFENGVISYVSDVESSYWELYFTYRDLEARIAGRDSALVTWQGIAERARLGLRGGEPENEAQARTQFFVLQAQVQDALGGPAGLYQAEQRVRSIMGLPPNGPRLIRPTTEPTTAKFVFQWREALDEAFVRRVELRRQKWQIKRSELQVIAARNFLMPRLDGVALYRWRGLGDNLIGPRGPTGLENAWQNMTGGDFQEWQVGLELSVPIGYRREMTALRNAELQLARNRAIFEEQERQVTHGLSNSVRQLKRTFELIQTNFNRRVAAYNEVQAFRARYDAGFVELNIWLQAIRRLAEADSAFYRSVVDYNLALRDVHFEKGSLLDFDGVTLAEGLWSPAAQRDAHLRAEFFRPKRFDSHVTQPPPLAR